MGIKQYMEETKGELKHVTWLSRAQSINYTVIVILISVLTGALLGLCDYIFSSALQKLF